MKESLGAKHLFSMAIFKKKKKKKQGGIAWKHTPLICTMVSGIRSRILEYQRRDEWPCEYGRFLIQPVALISLSMW